MKGYFTMPYGYLTDPSLARDFWAIYTRRADEAATQTRRGRTRPTEEDHDPGREADRRPPSAEHGRRRNSTGGRRRRSLRSARAARGRASRRRSGPPGGRSSTGAGWTARRASCASPLIPGPTERIAHRTLVGDAGQRVQGFLTKLGLTQSYLCVNAFPYALHPSFGADADELLAEPDAAGLAQQFYDAVRPGAVEAVIAFGAKCAEGVRPLAEQAERARGADSRIRAAATRQTLLHELA